VLESREGGQEPGAKKRRLAASRRPDESEQGRRREASEKLVDETLAPEEQLRVVRLERGKALERTAADLAPTTTTAAVRKLEQRILNENRTFHFLQLEARLEPELAAQQRARVRR
jgi:hypothetical protein